MIDENPAPGKMHPVTESPADAIDLFLSASVQHANALAIRSGPGSITYAALVRRVRAYAAAFSRFSEPKVLIALPRGLDAYAAMLAAGLAGGFYATVNEAAPMDRLNHILGQFQPNIVVAASGMARPLAAAAPWATFILPADLNTLASFSGRGVRHRTALVMFSNAPEPVGLAIPRQALNTYVGWLAASGTIRPKDTVSQYSNLAFELSLLEIYGSLCMGAALVPVSGLGDRLQPSRVIARERISVWVSTPSVIDMMRATGVLSTVDMASIRLFVLAGEPLLREQVEMLFALCPQAAIAYGFEAPETTSITTQVVLTAKDYARACHGSTVSIGAPVAGMEVSLAGGRTPNQGDVVLTGPLLAEHIAAGPPNGLARTDPSGTSTRRFTTGLWAERRGGLLFQQPRPGREVRVGGNKVLLEDVAGAIRRCGWSGVCVFPYAGGLAAIVEGPESESLDCDALRNVLATRLPPHAVPERIAAVRSIPRDENDRIDLAVATTVFQSLNPIPEVA
jgi:D-alanine--poly(phosphoribitol) ligase subunit 1